MAAAKKKAAAKKTEGAKLLSLTKTLRVLKEKFNVSEADFMKAYAADTQRGPAGPRDPSPEEVAAVKAFRAHYDIKKLAETLGVSVTAANAAVVRVMSHEGKK